MSSATALRPLRAIERLLFSGVRDPSETVIATGMIGSTPFELLVEPHTLQLHVLLGNELVTYALFIEDHKGGSTSSRAALLLADIRQGAHDMDLLAQRHSLDYLEGHPAGRQGQLPVPPTHPNLH